MAEIEWTDEQKNILRHPPDTHALILAGPGTGKSTVVIALADRLSQLYGPGCVRLATFTRAATAELADKAVDGDLRAPVTTVHSFALRLLRTNQHWNRLPLPIRIPDDWELKNLIYADLRDRLAAAAADWKNLRKSKVERLIREMGSRFEALDEELILEANIDPALRDAFIARWQYQRRVFGYSLFQEMPWYAYELILDHPDADLGNLRVFIIDEYQDLNACELRLVRSLADRNIVVIAVGDDEQSIYSWRMAAPTGIRRFTNDYSAATPYPLTLARRFGKNILRPSQRLIATSPNRLPDRPLLQSMDTAASGIFAYLFFRDAAAERRAVIELIRRHLKNVRADKIAVLMRSDYRNNWSREIREMLEACDIPVRDVEAAIAPLTEAGARAALATCRLLIDDRDDLAWWTLLKLKRNCSDSYIRFIAEAAYDEGVRFHERLLRFEHDPLPGTLVSQRAAQSVVANFHKIRDHIGPLVQFETPADLVNKVARLMSLELEPAFLALVTAANNRLLEERGRADLDDLLGQLEPVAKDLALRAPGVALMNIASSKGLTFEVTITIGVEDEVFTSPNPYEREELRRLLYVAMTRAQSACYLTMSTERPDATAFSFASNNVYTRSRCTFLSLAGISPVCGPEYLRRSAATTFSTSSRARPPASPQTGSGGGV